MESENIRVTIGEKTYRYPAGVRLAEIVQDYQKEHAVRKDAAARNEAVQIAAAQSKAGQQIVLAKTDGMLRELHHALYHDCTLTFVTIADKEGYSAFRRSLTLLMLKALYHEAGRTHIRRAAIHFSIGSGYYCTIDGDVTPDAAFLAKVKAYMLELTERKIPITKETVSTDKALALFSQYGMKDKEKLFHYRRTSRVNLYNMDGFEDYFYGYMAPDTSCLKQFELYPYEEGFILQMPSRTAPDAPAPFSPEKKLFQVRKESMRWGEMLEIPTVGALNDHIVRHGAQDLILVQEALQEKKIAEIAEQIASDRSKKIIMISGPSSSGKTTFSHRLSIQLTAHGLKPHPIPVDDYFVNREDTPLDAEGKPDYECLDAIDVELFNHDMQALLRGEAVSLPTYNFLTGRREYRQKIRKLEKDDILVIEGIHCLNENLSYSLPAESKFKIYISALTQLNVDEHNQIPTTDGRLLRRIVRDARTRGSSAKQTIAMWPSVRRGEESYIFPYQEEADVMFNSALIYELAALKLYAEPLLFGISRKEPEYQEAKRLLKFLDYFVGIPEEGIPKNSILREFIGGGCFQI